MCVCDCKRDKMCVTQVSLLFLFILISSVSCEEGKYRPVPDTARICLATYVRHLDNELLLGTWYNVYLFAPSDMPDSEECREFVLTRPKHEDMARYKKAYNLTGMPYTFKEDAILYNDKRNDIYSGLLLGNRAAKFFLENPRKCCVHSESYDVALIRYITENYILFEKCSMQGNFKWLMSKTKHASDEKLQKIISSQNDLMSMQSQKYCAVVRDPLDYDAYDSDD